MSDLVQQWLLQLGLPPLPALETTCLDIQNLLQCPAANYAQFTNIIKYDPGFSLSALRTINSSHYKNKTQIIDINHAIPLLGMTWLENSAATLPKINQQYSEEQYKGITHCYSKAVHASCYAFYLATQQKNPNANEIATMALLKNMAEMALWVSPSPIAQKIQSLTHAGKSIDEAVMSCLDVKLDYLNEALQQQWHLTALNPLLTQPDHTNLERKIYIDLAYKINQADKDGWYHSATLETFKLSAEYLNTNPNKLIPQIHNITAEIAHKIHPLGLPCSAFNLLLIPEKIECSHTPAIKTKPGSKKKHQPEITPSPNTPSSPAASVVEAKSQDKTEDNNPAHQLISRALHNIQRLNGLSRVVFIVLTQDHKQLVAQTILDDDKNSKIEQFQASVGKHDLFSILLRKPKAIWMNSEKLVEYARLMPQQTYHPLEAKNFFAMSLFSKTKPIGLIYADNGANSAQLNKTTYHDFKRLCQRISNDLKQR